MAVTQPLSVLCDVVVEVSPLAVSSPQFNQGLVIGPSAVIPSTGATNPRIRQYTGIAAMATDGFSPTSPEYLAAQLYFGVNNPPQYLWVGRQDLTAISTAIPHSANAGTGYAVGDVVTVTQVGASNGQLTVLTVGAGGAVETLGTTVGNQGTGYSVATGLSTTGGSGNGLEVDITAIGESALQAAQACRAASAQWYSFMVTDANDSDHEAIALWVQSVQPQSTYFYTTQTADVVNGVTPNVMQNLSAGNYNRVIGTYATTQGNLYPNQIYFASALMGAAMGANSGLANSYYTLKGSEVTTGMPGVYPEPLTSTQIANIAKYNGNCYVSYAGVYSIFQQGTVANGQFFDEILNLDILASGIQYGVIDLLTSVPSVPMTDAGQAQLINAVEQACAQAASVGFIAPGVWNGAAVLNLKKGQALQAGYSVQSPPYSTQSAADRAARKAMPIYVCLTEAGAVHSVVVGIFVQR